jgi:hypothetical protein
LTQINTKVRHGFLTGANGEHRGEVEIGRKRLATAMVAATTIREAKAPFGASISWRAWEAQFSRIVGCHGLGASRLAVADVKLVFHRCLAASICLRLLIHASLAVIDLPRRKHTVPRATIARVNALASRVLTFRDIGYA